MPKLIVSIDGVVIKEVQLTKDRTTLGRRPYNDVVIDNLAVSGEHAVFQMSGDQVYLEDLDSTNGTCVNGKAVKKQLLKNRDTIEICKYLIEYVSEADAAATVPPAAAAAGPGAGAALQFISGAAAGRRVALVKAVTTLGKPGVAVAAITKTPEGFVLTSVSGPEQPTLNGVQLGAEPAPLKHGDRLELAGTQMQFVQY